METESIKSFWWNLTVGYSEQKYNKKDRYVFDLNLFLNLFILGKKKFKKIPSEMKQRKK